MSTNTATPAVDTLFTNFVGPISQICGTVIGLVILFVLLWKTFGKGKMPVEEEKKARKEAVESLGRSVWGGIVDSRARMAREMVEMEQRWKDEKAEMERRWKGEMADMERRLMELMKPKLEEEEEDEEEEKMSGEVALAAVHGGEIDAMLALGRHRGSSTWVNSEPGPSQDGSSGDRLPLQTEVDASGERYPRFLEFRRLSVVSSTSSEGTRQRRAGRGDRIVEEEEPPMG
ncbi:MAG: hypothetical protein Q9174_004085 [Haloplaca sp. 1 TL-2023]